MIITISPLEISADGILQSLHFSNTYSVDVITFKGRLHSVGHKISNGLNIVVHINFSQRYASDIVEDSVTGINSAFLARELDECPGIAAVTVKLTVRAVWTPLAVEQWPQDMPCCPIWHPRR